jgi:hypothetical protein
VIEETLRLIRTEGDIILEKEFCITGEGKYPKNFVLNTPTELVMPKWYAIKTTLPFTELEE